MANASERIAVTPAVITRVSTNPRCVGYLSQPSGRLAERASVTASCASKDVAAISIHLCCLEENDYAANGRAFTRSIAQQEPPPALTRWYFRRTATRQGIY